MPQAITPEAVMAIAVLKANQAGRPLEIEDISGLFVELKNSGVPVGEVALRKVPGAFYSEDVEAFVGRLLAAGDSYATARSPIKFEQDGLRICRTILHREFEDNEENLAKLASALGFDLSSVTSPAPA